MWVSGAVCRRCEMQHGTTTCAVPSVTLTPSCSYLRHDHRGGSVLVLSVCSASAQSPSSRRTREGQEEGGWGEVLGGRSEGGE